jgi:Bacterial Ig-like domain (group 3)
MCREHKVKKLLFVAHLLAFGLAGNAAAYRAVDIHPSGYVHSYSKSVNAAGHVAGLACDAQQNCDVFYWTGLGTSPRILTRASGINSRVVVNNNGEVFADTAGGIYASGPNGGTLRQAMPPGYFLLGANDLGQIIVGTGFGGGNRFYFVASPPNGVVELGPLPNGARVLSADGINNSGQVVGRLETNDTLRNPYVYITGANGSGLYPINNLLFQYVSDPRVGASRFNLAGVNDAGQIAGYAGDASDAATRGFYTSPDRNSFQNYPQIGGRYFLPRSFNGTNQAVGLIYSNGEYIYTNGALTKIQDLVPSQSSSWSTINAITIGAAGDISANGRMSGTNAEHALVLTSRAGKTPSNSTISGIPAQLTTGLAATATATVNGDSPTGAVQWSINGSVVQGTTLVTQSSTAATTTFQIPANLPIGTHTISFEYQGDDKNLKSQSPQASVRIVEVPVASATVPTAPQWMLIFGAVALFSIAAHRGLRRKS